jgi:hypothetical protein
MKNKANQNSLKDPRTILLVSGVVVGLIIALFIILADVSFANMMYGMSDASLANLSK